MRPKFYFLVWSVGIILMAPLIPLAQGQSLALEIRQQDTPVNHLSPAGKPLSDEAGVPAGSDGRLETPDQQAARGLTSAVPTVKQFRGFVSYGAVVRTRPGPAGAGGYASYAAYARDVLPQGGPAAQRIYIARAQVGAPYISRRLELRFGEIVALPDTDVHQISLDNLEPVPLPEDYWQREPYWPEENIVNGVHIDAPYYWSRHARAVFANRPGPIEIAWRRTAAILGAEPEDYENDRDHAVIDGRVYPLLRRSYLVSSSPVKSSRRMYWTEGSFQGSGLPVNVPEGVTINFVYADSFPRTVEEAYTDPGSSPPVAPGEGEIFTELRTIFYDADRGSIRAFNWQGRILLELLGDGLEGNRRQHLGIEIVDVVRRVNPANIRVELGEKLTAWQDGDPDDSHLLPRSLLRPTDSQFGYQHFQDGERVQFYAIRETVNQNDFLLHWTEEGVEGLQWPFLFTRYEMVWPSDIGKFSHYVRPLVASEAEARETAVEMPLNNVPIIEYQDPLDRPRAKLTETFAFYTFLSEQYSAHRTLLRFMSGDHVRFERVFSWLGDDLRVDESGTLLARNRLAEMLGGAAGPGNSETRPPMLTAWNPETKSFVLHDRFVAPRVVEHVALVGERIVAPEDETRPMPDEPYWAGHIRVEKGTSYNPYAYIDPFVDGFEAANAGAIIPVNAIPGENMLEVWWFRANRTELEKGFERIFWPSVVAHYTLEWPASWREIVLASNDGSGALPSLEAAGRIYAQNDPELHGYNPNEEHALMIGGQAYALRDDLNLVEPEEDYSSEPYVLLEYTAEDRRPAMSVFRVLRQKPEAGQVFDYVVEAGTILQAPMPLPLMPPPLDGIGAAAVNYNTEPDSGVDGDLPGGWSAAQGGEHYGHYSKFTFLDRKDSFWVYRGLHAGPPELEAGTFGDSGEFTAPVDGTAVAGKPFRYVLHASQRSEALRLSFAEGTPVPGWLTVNGLALEGTPGANVDAGDYSLTLRVSSLFGDEPVDLNWTLHVAESGEPVGQAELERISKNPATGTEVTHFGRPPYLAGNPGPENSFTMRFYYKTQEGFAWPGIEEPPPVDSIVPYLRPLTGGGDPAAKETESLDIVYRPVWPVETPGMRLGDTLMTPKEGLPAIRGQTSVSVLYQQSIAKDVEAAAVSVVLHDATREKEIAIAEVGLDDLPAGVRRETYQGRVYFPNLPPHLVERFFFDPFRGPNGHLVFGGELREEVLGSDYLLLNVLRGEDLQAVKDLCPVGDLDKNAWDQAVDGLEANVETFHENPSIPGEYIPGRTVPVGIEQMVEVEDHNTAVDSYALSASGPGVGYVTILAGGGAAFTPEAEPVSMHIIRIEPVQYPGDLKIIAATNPLSEQVTLQHSPDLAGRYGEYEYEWRIAAPVDGFPPPVNSEAMVLWNEIVASGPGLPRYTLGGANYRTLSDNYLIVRYRPKKEEHPLHDVWSDWTSPMLAEGWIKRVLAGLNPFQQRITDLFNNSVSTDVSMLTQAGARWEGDIALNLANINDYGLIEIYETVLRRGRMLSIEAGINYGPANDALLLAAGYLNDLYMFVGNEAWADAANPTIGIGTADQNYGDVATSMFAFQGQTATLLEEELALIRGRDDFFQPGTRISPVYNRLIWNYTRGIDAGEVIYALNYNVQEKPDGEPTGTIDASDAARMYPQGHGDAYGHYLTALKGYYSLFMNPDFDWVPRVEAVLVLGQPVSVDYFDERKLARAAAAVARAGLQAFDLTWRRDYESGEEAGWEHFAETRGNPQTGRTRHWGMDHWATRTGQGAYVNWVIGNAILPDEDPNPDHEGIQKIDRTTVVELTQLPILMDSLQTNLNNAESGLTPLGLPEGGIAFDIDPREVATGRTHFEQIYDRALTALNNAVAAFDDAKDVTRMMRVEEDSLAALQDQVAKEEHAFRNALIELYGTPYPDDIGPGRTYVTSYDGPDLLHYMYVDLPELPGGKGLAQSYDSRTYRLDVQTLPVSWRRHFYMDLDFYQNQENQEEEKHYIEYTLGAHGFFDKPDNWTGIRRSPGRIQQTISELIAAHQGLAQSLASAQAAQAGLEKKIRLFNARVNTGNEITEIERGLMVSAEVMNLVNLTSGIVHDILNAMEEAASSAAKAAESGIPRNFVAGLASGGDVASAARAAILAADTVAKGTVNAKKLAAKAIVQTLTQAQKSTEAWVRFETIENSLKYDQQLREEVAALGAEIGAMSGHLRTINERLRALDDAERKYRAAVAQGDRILEEREIFRRGSASIVQGFRTRDAAFRIFRNEKLERYKTLFDLAARYTYLAAQAFDYETGLLHTNEGREFIDRIIAARALGIVSDGEPQFAGGTAGDPGLSSVLAEMMGDWNVLRGRLGFNNPDTYGTTVSLRQEAFRIRPGEESDEDWRDLLEASWQADILADADVRRHAMQAGVDGFPVPGLVVSFSTTVATGRNLFGHPLAPGDHAFSPTLFATKIHSVGVALEGYRGMSNPSANGSGIDYAGGETPEDPPNWWLDPDALAATPYVYLIPVGADSMRSPPLGDSTTVRTWQVNDVTVPLPFNIGASEFSTLQWWQSSDFLSEEMFSVRKHQAFRPVSSADIFSFNLYGSGGTLQPSQYTNSRLIGRSVWNSEWKLVIPGDVLLSDPEEGLRRFIRTVEDIKLHFITYSYSGN